MRDDFSDEARRNKARALFGARILGLDGNADEIRRAQARIDLESLAPRRDTPGQYACWETWGPGVPCLHPDGVGHVGPHGFQR